MSMISSLIDKLRKSADEWNGSNMFELARMCSEAADTIWQLRDDLQRANAENAKLQASNEVIAEDHAALCEHNAKLRELLIDILSYVYDGGFNCSEGTWSCPYFQGCFNCPIEEGPERYVRRGCRWLVRAVPKGHRS